MPRNYATDNSHPVLFRSLEALADPPSPRRSPSPHNPALDPEREYEHGVLEKSADLAPERFTPMVFPDGLRASGRPGNPARSLVLVVEVLATENRFEDAFLVANDQLVLDRKEQHRNRQE